ncbi:hypothetical protein EDC04DRAFT_2773540 [Pisolithus marmoratus]|nr:hypothetical protein EDC04DRAFT_2773540 [Pisolithus marmoratus]
MIGGPAVFLCTLMFSNWSCSRGGPTLVRGTVEDATATTSARVGSNRRTSCHLVSHRPLSKIQLGVGCQPPAQILISV